MTVNYREKAASEYLTAARIQKEVDEYKRFKRLVKILMLVLVVGFIAFITH